MSSRKEEERNEKIIRGLMKLPPNRRCINCDSIGPQYVCTNFWTFICIACSGIHREFTHRVKSVSMAKFTTQEVEALQKGGNQRAREIYLKNWDLQRQRLPNSSNPDRMREFIKSVYLDKKYAGGNASEKPPRDVQNHRNNEEEHRRASSYHSYSQSPPYEHQYEERRYGRQAVMLTRKPGSDRGHYDGKISSFIHSSGHSLEQMYEDRFANEGSGAQASDYSVSSAGDPFRSGAQSPSSLKDIRISSPPVHAGKEILSDDAGRLHISSYSEANTKRDRTASAGSFGSFDSNSISFKSVHSFGFADVVLEPEQSVGSVQSSASVGAPHQGHLNSVTKYPIETLINPPLDLFSDNINQPPSVVKTPEISLQPPIELFADFNDKPLMNLHSFANSLASPIDLFASTTHETASVMQQPTTSSASPVELFASTTQLFPSFQNQQMSSGAPLDLFAGDQVSSSGEQHPSTSSAPPVDLFAEVNQQPSSWTPLEQKQPSVPFTESEGWATFDLPQLSKLPPETKQDSPLNSGGVVKEKLEIFSSTGESRQWSSINSSTSHESLAYGAANIVQPSTAPNSSQSWNAFDDSTGNFPQTLFENLGPKVETQVAEQKSCTNTEHCDNSENSQHLIKEGLQRLVMEDRNTVLNVQFDIVASGSFFPAMEGSDSHSHHQKSTNPFDLPYDSELEPSGEFLDMTSLQATLPDPSIQTAFLGSVTHPWFPQNPVASYIPTVRQGSLVYMPGQEPGPQLPNLSSRGPVASLGGNPFA
ncbi:probable ADP-ribosylation factor GTPase-activating protein AGD14 isoform X2 [Aristolochia californica]|uniref:probable ADP-ribosylation factor GTPase-activating protein AGD14 isoform X2 n=1 Tax=Aristolochia californica TaxID=171875 RepID=UPI0035DF5B1E